MAIAATPERVEQIVADFDSYPTWQKEVVAIAVLERDANERATRVEMTTEAMGMSTTNEISIAYDTHKIEYHLVKGDMTTTQDAVYLFTPNDGGGTDLELEMAVGLKWKLPPFMINRIVTKGIDDQLDAIKRIAEAR
jgi:ribosome-associated toxin RatA of RatAB toxin-antitoxin module